MRDAEQNCYSKLGVINRNTNRIATVNMRISLGDPWKEGISWPKDYFNCSRYTAQYHSQTKGDYKQRIRVSLHVEVGEVDTAQGLTPSFNWTD